MMKFMRKSQGYISIFLCLVMLPMVTFAAMVIDVSRLQSAKASITSAGDLAMNAALSEYEDSLQELYGLFATVSNEDELQTALQSYFAKTISSTIGTGSLSEDQYIQKMSDNIASLILGKSDYSTTDFTNFIEMQLDGGEDAFSYSGVEKSALANPAVMKQQIVDYMKYKGPISMASTLLSKLKFLKDTSNQTKAVQKKVEYTKTLNDLEDPCEKAYQAIIGNNPDDLQSDIGYNDFVHVYNALVEKKEFSKKVEQMKDSFDDMSQYNYYYYQIKAMKDKFGGFSYEKMKNVTIDNDGAINDYSDFGTASTDFDNLVAEFNNLVNYNNTDKKPFENYFGNIKVEFNDNESAVIKSFELVDQPKDNQYYACDSNMNDWLKELELPTSTGGGSTKISPDEKYDERYELQAWLSSHVASFSEFVRYYEQMKSLNNKIKDAWTAYEADARTEAEAEFDKDVEDNPDTYKDMDQEALDAAKEGYVEAALVKNGLLDKNRIVNVLNKIVETLEGYKTKYNNLLKGLNDIDCFKTVANTCVYDALDSLDEYYIIICKSESQAETVSKCLDEILKSIENVEQKRIEWGASIDNVQDDAMKTTFKSDLESMTNGIEKDDVKNLQIVANECKAFFEELRIKFESIKFFDVQVFSGGKDFNVINASDNQFKTYFKQQEYKEEFTYNDIDTSGKIETKAEILNQAKLVYDSVKNVTLKIGNKLDGKKAAKNPTVDDEKEKFFYMLQSICNPKKATDDGSSVKKVQDIQEGADKESTNYTKDSEGNDKKGADEGDKDGGKPGAASEDFKAAIQAINNYTGSTGGAAGIDSQDGGNTKDVKVTNDDDYSGNADNASDSLGAAASVLSMFTDLAETAMNKAYLEEYFTEMFTCQTDTLKDNQGKKLLNGKAISELNQNTEWYGYEMEYLIWGDNSMKANRIKNEAMIYTIRFALNAIFAFTSSTIQTFAFETATAIAGWTVIGVPVVQVCITIALAMAESAYDLYRLKNGQDVPIFKNDSNFVCSPLGFMKTAVTEITTTVIKKVSDEVGNKINEGIDNIAAKGKTKLKDLTGDIENLVKEYTDEQAENLKSLISNHFTTPLINKITPILTMASATQSTINKNIDDAIDDAFKLIKSSIDSESDGIVKELSLLAFDKCSADKEVLKNRLKPELLKTDVSANGISKLINSYVEKWVNSISEPINKKAEEFGKKLREEIDKHGDEAAENIKSIVGDKINSLSEELTSKATQAIAGKLKDGALNMTDVTAAGGLTLNYKEYCKIFMIINVAADENKVLKRCAALVQANVRHADGGNDKFDITKAHTLVSVDASVKLGTLFPWTVSVTENNSAGESGIAFDFSHLGSNYVTIDYSGVNGY